MTTVTRYRSRMPGEIDGPIIPAIFVNEATGYDYEHATLDDADCSSMQTCIFYWSATGKRTANRIAQDLRATGVALVYPYDMDVRVYVGSKHRVIEIGARIGTKE